MMNFQPITVNSQTDFKKYENLRSVYVSEGYFLNQFLWKDYYHTQYATDDIALYLLIWIRGHYCCFPPLCKKEHIPEAFFRLEQYFQKELNEPLTLYLADTEFVDMIERSDHAAKYTVTPDRDSFDYIYDGDRLRTLSGKAMHKKKNLLNRFLRQYEGRYEYVSLSKEHAEEIKNFHEEWLHSRTVCDKYHSIQDEEKGLFDLFDHLANVTCKLGGVRIDGELKAYTIGSYQAHIKTAFIHIEKADTGYHGLYNYINQQFLIHEFPEAVFINREDDLGQENLRHAKLSYRPLRLEEKFTIAQNL